MTAVLRLCRDKTRPAPPRPKLPLFLSSTNTPVRALLRPILLIGGLSVWSLELPRPTPFVRIELLVQHRRETFGKLRTTMLKR